MASADGQGLAGADEDVFFDHKPTRASERRRRPGEPGSNAARERRARMPSDAAVPAAPASGTGVGPCVISRADAVELRLAALGRGLHIVRPSFVSSAGRSGPERRARAPAGSHAPPRATRASGQRATAARPRARRLHEEVLQPVGRAASRARAPSPGRRASPCSTAASARRHRSSSARPSAARGRGSRSEQPK